MSFTILNQNLAGNGSNTQFTLITSTANSVNIVAAINGLVQTPEIDYTVSGTTITFTTAPLPSSEIEIRYYNYVNDGSGYVGSTGPIGYTGSTGPQGPSGGYTGSAGQVGLPTSSQNITANGSSTTFTMNQVVLDPNNIIVTINGIMQTPTTDYTVSGSNLTFSFTPTINSAIEIRYFGSVGLTGYRGSAGATGYSGSLGQTGYGGSVGFTGSAGISGYTGSVGPQGFAGTTGYVGSIGYTGSQGATGYVGSVGSIGYTGSIGYSGSQGTLGYTGSQGSIGPAGAPSNSQSITADGINSSFTMSQIVTNPNYVLVTVNGLLQIPTTDYTVSGTTITFVNKPYINSLIELRFFGEIGSQGYQGSVGYQGSAGAPGIGYVGSAGSIGYTGSAGAGYTGSMGPVGAPSDYQVFTANGSTSSFSMRYSVPSESGVLVAINGLLQIPVTDYTVSGNVINFSTTPNYSSEIELRYFEVVQGYRGSVGFQGSAGNPGIGYIGSTGFTGSVGFTGSMGSQGPVGAPQDSETIVADGTNNTFTMKYIIYNAVSYTHLTLPTKRIV